MMIETDVVVSHLRSQSRNLQTLLCYLESRKGMTQEDYSYLNTKLQEVISRLKEMEKFSSQRGEIRSLRMHRWLN